MAPPPARQWFHPLLGDVDPKGVLRLCWEKQVPPFALASSARIRVFGFVLIFFAENVFQKASERGQPPAEPKQNIYIYI